ncbi:GNAT family N-acetyltransferase [Nocardioides pantholopis]|uniref:GNAT family N-acetyltransferase n=1 Tax=Nocardioides pantholopis TaxID=2483798 RepID=UPI000FDA7D2B|nr:GNAT family N-acetyltransferase [Nocardioides pantholopis]
MSTVLVERVDPGDEDVLRAWWEVGAQSVAHDRPFPAWPAWEVARSLYPRPRSDVARTLLVARRDGVVVGSGFLVLFLLDNTHLAEPDVHVLPAHRRHGVGRAVLAQLERLAVAEGRTALIGTACAPVGAESPSTLFAAACGYPVANREETKLLDLRTAPARWPALDAKVAARLDGYRVEVFDTRVPDRWVAEYCRLVGRFRELVPSGDLELTGGDWTPQRLHESEERHRAVGRDWGGVLAVSPGGRLVGCHDLLVPVADPRVASVGGTMVLPEHRGHRLGLAMKLAGHRHLLDRHPACTAVVTGNAGVNARMNAVNQALGYRVVERSLDVQKLVGAPPG